MKRFLFLVTVLSMVLFATNLNAQIQGGRTDKAIGFYDPILSDDGLSNITTIDFNTIGVDGQRFSLNAVRGISGVSWSFDNEGAIVRTPIISGYFWRAFRASIRTYRFVDIASFSDSLQANTTGFVSATASYDSVICNKANLILDIPGAEKVKFTDVETADTLVNDQAMAFWPGKSKSASIDMLFNFTNALSNLNSDISFDLITMDGGNSNDQLTVKMIVSLGGSSGDASDYVENIETLTTSGQHYVVENVFNTADGVVGEASRKRINICELTGLSPMQLRMAGSASIRLVYSTSTGGNFVEYSTENQTLTYAPVLGVDNIYCESPVVSWVFPLTTKDGQTGGVSQNERIYLNTSLYIGEETPFKFYLKSANRYGAMKIIIDSPLHSVYSFKPTGCIKAADANGNYTIDVPYDISESKKDAITIANGRMTIQPNADGSVSNDDLEITIYGLTNNTFKRDISIEVDHGVRFWFTISGTGVERVYSPSTVQVSTVAELKAALADTEYKSGEDITVELLDCTDEGGIYQFGTTRIPFPQLGTNLTIKAADGHTPQLWGSFNSSNGMKVQTIHFDGLKWDGGDSTLVGFNGDPYQPFTLAAGDSVMNQWLVTNCTFVNLDNQRIFRANNPANAVCKLLVFENNYFDNMGWNRAEGTPGNTFIQLGDGAGYECDNFVFKNNIVKNFHGNQLFNMPRRGTTAAEPNFAVTIENNTFYRLGGAHNSTRNFLEYTRDLNGNNVEININNNLIYERWGSKGPVAQLALFEPKEGQTMVLNVNNNLFYPDTVSTKPGETQNLVISAGSPTTVTRNDLTMASLGTTTVFDNMDELLIEKGSVLYTAGTNGTYIGAEQSYFSARTRVAYITKAKTMAEGAATVETDPVYLMLKADENLDVTLVSITDASAVATFDQTPYDVLVIQESFGGGDAILKPGGALALAGLTKPFVYNKMYALKSDRALPSGGTAAGGETKGTYYISVNAAKQSHDLFKGFTFASNKVKLFRSGAADNGADTDTKALSYASNVVISVENTLLGLPANITATPTVSFSDVPAGAVFGGETLAARMIAMGMNFGSICKNNGTNLTDAGLTIWRNAVYVLAGLEVPAVLVDAPGEDPALSANANLSALSVSAGTLSPAFSADVAAYSINLPTGTTTATIAATAADGNATVAGIGAATFTAAGTTANVVVTAEDGSTKTYAITITVGVSAASFDLAGIKLYPNPANNYINISGVNQNTRLKVMNANGRIMLNKIANSNDVTLDISGLVNGIYLVHIEQEGNVFTSKFLKQ